MAARVLRFSALALGMVVFVSSVVTAQPPGGYNIVPAPTRINTEDDEDTWTLNIQFKSPRVITTTIPGRGERRVWYLWYQVWNTTGKPRMFIPDFEIVTDRDMHFRDQILPSVQDEIRKIEDPTGFYDIKNSVTIAAKPIPPSKPDANPIYVTAVALFPEVVEKVPDTNRFSLFISGLSNGWSKDPNNIIRRKTLQLNFRRLADSRVQDANAIKFVPPVEWIYRATGLKVEAKDAAPAAPTAPATPTNPGGG